MNPNRWVLWNELWRAVLLTAYYEHLTQHHTRRMCVIQGVGLFEFPFDQAMDLQTRSVSLPIPTFDLRRARFGNCTTM